MKKTWLITGCSSGLGIGIAHAVLEQGDSAVVTARKPETLEELSKIDPERVLAARLDLNDRESMREAVDQAVSRFGGIDVLVNNAGHGYRAAIEEGEDERIRELFETNFFGPVELIRMVLPVMREKRSGLIINVTSIGAVRGALGNGYYSAAKGALELATEALRKETAHLGIRTMLVEPGAMRTGFFDDRLEGSEVKIRDYDAIASSYRKESSVNHHDQPDDPEKCGRIIVRTAVMSDAPERLLLGSDALRAAESYLNRRLIELRKWRESSIAADFEN